MTIGHRPDPNQFAGAEARRQAYNERGRRLSKLSAQPWGRLVAKTLIIVAVMLAAAGVVAWLASSARGY